MRNSSTYCKSITNRRRVIHQHYVMALVNAPATKTCSHKELLNYRDTVKHNLTCQEESGQPEADVIWTSLLTASFPKALKGHWQHFTKTKKNVPGVDVLLKFLEDRILSTPLGSTPVAAPEPKQEPHGGQRQQFTLPSAPSLSIDSRSNHIQTSKLCYNCLGAGHQTRECHSLSRCKKCSGKHRTTLHWDQAISSGPVEAAALQEHTTVNVSANNVSAAIQPSLMMTSWRALLDNGLTQELYWILELSMSLVSNRAVQCLQLPKTPINITLSRVQGIQVKSRNCLVNLTISSLQNVDKYLSLTAAVVNKVSCELLIQSATSVRELPHIKHLI